MLPEEFQTQRLRCRRLRSTDGPAIFQRWAQDPEVSRFLEWQPHQSLEESVAHAERCDAAWEAGTTLTWILEDALTAEALGSIAAHRAGHRVGLGYLLARPVWGRGLMTEAVTALRDMLGEVPEVHRIWAVCDVDNVGSARVLQKSDFELEGTLRRWIVHPNVSPEPRDVRCFSYIPRRSAHASRQPDSDPLGSGEAID
jgi:RimJ/RimL family protein N-acetyltransferase